MLVCPLWRQRLDPAIEESVRLAKLEDSSRMFLRELLMGKGSWLVLKDRGDAFVLELLEDPEHFHMVQETDANATWLSTCLAARVLFRVPSDLHSHFGKTLRSSNRFASTEETQKLYE